MTTFAWLYTTARMGTGRVLTLATLRDRVDLGCSHPSSNLYMCGYLDRAGVIPLSVHLWTSGRRGGPPISISVCI